MSSNDCTESGSRVWLFLDIVFGGLLLFELGAFHDAWVSNPELETKLGLVATTAMLGVAAGSEMFRQGLTNANLRMPMRVTLVTVGVATAVISLVTGLLAGMGVL